MNLTQTITIKPGLIAVRWQGRLYESKVAGYAINGQPVSLAQIPMQVRYWMACATGEEATL